MTNEGFPKPSFAFDLDRLSTKQVELFYTICDHIISDDLNYVSQFNPEEVKSYLEDRYPHIIEDMLAGAEQKPEVVERQIIADDNVDETLEVESTELKLPENDPLRVLGNHATQAIHEKPKIVSMTPLERERFRL